ncbi:hypothetical protein CF319_g7492, partial [Tilletia indica]
MHTCSPTTITSLHPFVSSIFSHHRPQPPITDNISAETTMVSGDAEGAANEATKGSPSKSPSRNPSLLRGIGAALGLRRLSPERGSTSSLPMSPPQVPAASSQSSPTSSLRSPDAPSSASATSEAVLSTGAAAPVLASTPETPTPGSSDSVTLTGAIHGSASSAIPAEHHSPGIRAS